MEYRIVIRGRIGREVSGTTGYFADDDIRNRWTTDVRRAVVFSTREDAASKLLQIYGEVPSHVAIEEDA